jgi:RND family efflux transporter MFP subunit
MPTELGKRLIPILLACLLPGFARSEDYNIVEGFLAPYREIDVSTTETGIIASVKVRPGDLVKKGDVIVKLERTVLQQSLAVAQQDASATSNLKIAQAELNLQKSRYSKIKELFDSGHGRASELLRAASDLEIQQAKLLRAEEEIALKKQDVQQIQSRLKLRDVTSPIDGIVIKIHRDPGESVSPNNPKVVTVVNIDQLQCTFDVPRRVAKTFAKDNQVRMTLTSSKEIQGTVQWKSPLIDPESGTVKLIVRVDNPKHLLTSGEYCILVTEKSPLASSFPEPNEQGLPSQSGNPQGE